MERLDNFLTKYFYRIFWILSGLFLVMYFLLLGETYIWTDEAYSFGLIRHSFAEIWRITGEDNHPPMYFWYLKIIAAPFGYHMAAARLASVLPEMFILMFGGIQLRKCFQEKTAVLFMVLYFCYPFAMAHSTEVRMYSLASAFIFSCAVSAYKFLTGQGKAIHAVGLVLAGVLAAYTHYFAFVSVCVIYAELLVVILSKKGQLIRKWLGCVFISVLLYLPWVPSIVNQLVYKANHEYWIQKTTLWTIFSYVYRMFGVCTERLNGVGAVYTVFFGMTYLICLVQVLSGKVKKHRTVCICCLLVPIGTLVFGLIASAVIRPVFVIRYIVPTIPLLAVFMAVVLEKMVNKAMCYGILAVVLAGGAVQYGYMLHGAYTDFNYIPAENYSDVDAYIVIDDYSEHVAFTLAYYVTDKNIYFGGTIYGANPFPNIVPMEDYKSDTVEKAILLLHGQPVPDTYRELYDIEDLGQWKCEKETEAYLLTKKS